jgi:hypothetical protein
MQVSDADYRPTSNGWPNLPPTSIGSVCRGDEGGQPQVPLNMLPMFEMNQSAHSNEILMIFLLNSSLPMVHLMGILMDLFRLLL